MNGRDGFTVHHVALAMDAFARSQAGRDEECAYAIVTGAGDWVQSDGFCSGALLRMRADRTVYSSKNVALAEMYRQRRRYPGSTFKIVKITYRKKQK